MIRPDAAERRRLKHERMLREIRERNEKRFEHIHWMISRYMQYELEKHDRYASGGKEPWGRLSGLDNEGRQIWEGTIDYDVLARAVLDKLRDEGCIR